MTSTLEIHVAGRSLRCRSDRSLAVPATGLLLVADLHLDKAEHLRALHVPAPFASLEADLSRLGRAVAEERPEALIVLGDLYHAKGGASAPVTLGAFRRWRRAHRQLHIVLVEGNHDRYAGPPAPDLDIDAAGSDLFVDDAAGALVLTHEPRAERGAYVLAGHVHSGVRVGTTSDRLQVPAFRFGRETGVLPAFSSLASAAPWPPLASEQIVAITDGTLVSL
ncbi:MAG: ligase-associated DNA damage response endonuclease PdeM [Planctomycetota bacterium]